MMQDQHFEFAAEHTEKWLAVACSHTAPNLWTHTPFKRRSVGWKTPELFEINCLVLVRFSGIFQSPSIDLEQIFRTSTHTHSDQILFFKPEKKEGTGKWNVCWMEERKKKLENNFWREKKEAHTSRRERMVFLLAEERERGCFLPFLLQPT